MINKKLTNLEKLQKIKEETGRMERISLENDRQSGQPPSNNHQILQRFDGVDEANGMLLDAIKAKLAILDSQNEVEENIKR